MVGLSNLQGDKTNHAFLWSEDEGMQDLGTLPEDFSSAALGVNEEGQVVGTSADASGDKVASVLLAERRDDGPQHSHSCELPLASTVSIEPSILAGRSWAWP